MARLEGLEPPTHGLEGRCSIRLSYRRVQVSDSLPDTISRLTRKTRPKRDRVGLGLALGQDVPPHASARRSVTSSSSSVLARADDLIQ